MFKHAKLRRIWKISVTSESNGHFAEVVYLQVTYKFFKKIKIYFVYYNSTAIERVNNMTYFYLILIVAFAKHMRWQILLKTNLNAKKLKTKTTI